MRNLWLLFLVGLATGFISENVFVSSQSPSSIADDLYLEGQTSGDPIDIDEGKDDGLPIDDEDGGEDYGSGSGSGDYDSTDLMDEDEKLMRFVNLSRTPVFKEKVPSQPQPTTDSPHNPPATTADSQYPPTTKDIEKIEVPDVDSRGEEEASIDPAGDYVRPSNSDDNMPTSKTTPTEFTIDDSVNTDTDEDNSLDVWDVSTPRNSGDEVQIQEIENEIVAKDGKGSRIYEMESPKEVTSENLWERTEVLAAVIACGVVGFLCAVFLLLLLAYRMKKKDEGSYDLGDTKLSTAQYHKAPTKEFYA